MINMEEICSTCLSENRTLHKLRSFEPVYRLILPEIRENLQDLMICWECLSVVKKCHKFRRNVLKARDILCRLKRDVVESQDGVALKSLSSLQKRTQTKIDFNITLYDSNCIIDPDKKLVLEIEAESTTDVKIETPDEIEIDAPLRRLASDPLVPPSPAPPTPCPPHVPEEIFVEPAGDYGFDDDDSDSEVLSKVKVKMKKTNLPSDDEAMDESESVVISKKVKKSLKIKKKSKKVGFKIGKRKGKKDKKETSNAVEAGGADEPTREQVLEMFTSIEFCKNQYDVDGNNAEVLVMSQAEMKARRAVLKEDPLYADAKYKCKTCIIGYEEKTKLEDHNLINHVERPNEKQCHICLTYIHPNIYHHHFARHLVLFRCRVCGYCEDEVTKLLEHLKHHTRHKGQNYCWMCKTNFRNPRGLRLHKEKVHSGNKETFTCDKCGKTFNCSIYYRDHLKRHAYQPIPCKICNKICKSASAHSFHMKAHATLLSGEKFKCVECDIDFAQPVLLKNHFQTRKHMHPSEFKHICDVCGKGFLWASTLQEHVNYVHRKHTDYVCQICNKMFVSARCMRNHIKLVHEGHKPQKNKECNICGKRFAGKKTLTDHINTHTGVRPYKCDECGDTFKQAAALFTHRRLVHQGYRKTRRLPEVR